MDTSIHAIEFDSRAEGLLRACHLVASDLPRSNVLLFGHTSNDTLIGMFGLEVFGPNALLRSLAVAASDRGTGLGANLVSNAEQNAIALGVHSLYLLTSTAEKFFERLGYVHVKRTDAPAAIASSCQFSELCPSSSAFMVKQLDD